MMVKVEGIWGPQYAYVDPDMGIWYGDPDMGPHYGFALLVWPSKRMKGFEKFLHLKQNVTHRGVVASRGGHK